MSITFHIPAPLRQFTGDAGRVEIKHSAKTLEEALRALADRYPGISHRILNEQGQIREHINIFVGEESVRFTGGLAAQVEDGCEIFIIPAVSGG